ncbi:peptide/nickel transport system permease protein [Anaerosolibacter carboniphilus]|uniref:Peptide/nickel transport system permease protein n=1 Tax=Anaerosolibacter carboniphilus TaxID=1417629 RepID=A0A841KRV3_9FIRM|nr:ABC transporter permease [Anaerosolibacter carboniphilus]MBB6216123.1 peptide/nickel transport system permease protein [Anaerosolibacter carboniphilus]
MMLLMDREGRKIQQGKNILKFIGKNLCKMIILMLLVSIGTFSLINISPIDPVEAYIGADAQITAEHYANIGRHWGLDKSPLERFLSWFTNILTGDFGTSMIFRQAVIKVIGEKFKSSLFLMGTAWVLSGIIGFFLGIVAGVNKGRWPDKVIKLMCLTMSSAPTFWIALLIIMVFSVWLGWFPIGLAAPVGKLAQHVTLGERIYHLTLPALTLSITGVSNIALHTRQKMMDVLETDYVLFAKARGERGWTLIKRHGIKNIMMPAITLQFASFSELFGGSVLAEQVFSYPGLGQAATMAGTRGDVPLLLGITLFSAFFVFTGNLLADIIYGIISPEIREGLHDA